MFKCVLFANSLRPAVSPQAVGCWRGWAYFYGSPVVLAFNRNNLDAFLVVTGTESMYYTMDFHVILIPCIFSGHTHAFSHVWLHIQHHPAILPIIGLRGWEALWRW